MNKIFIYLSYQMTDEKKLNNSLSENEINKKDVWEQKNLTQALMFGSEEKILTREDKEKLIWGIFWVEQYGQTNYYKIKWVRSYNNDFEVEYLEPTRPSIGADKTELAAILREQWCNLIHQWRSGFESRNSYIVCRDEKKEKKIAPLIIVGNDAIWAWTLYEGEVLAESEVKIAMDEIERAKQELIRRRAEKMQTYITENTKGDISIISIWWWPEDFQYRDIPENYILINQRRIWCTQDHRRNMSHTYEIILIDKKHFDQKTFVKIQVPDEYKGLIIGKWWVTIKGLSEKLKCTISIR